MSFIVKGIDLPKHDEGICVTIWKDGIVYARDIKTDTTIEAEAEAIQIDKPWKECSCYQCKHRGTAPYEKPCSVCARNHKDYFEEI